MSAERDDLIASLLDSDNARVEEITVNVKGAEKKIRVRQASIASHGRLLAELQKAAKAEDAVGLDKAKVAFAVECAVDDEGKPLFVKEADKARVKEQPCVGWVEKVYQTALALMRAPAVTVCAAEVDVPAKDDKPAGKRQCGGALTLGAPKCPWCGSDVMAPAEAAEKNS